MSNLRDSGAQRLGNDSSISLPRVSDGAASADAGAEGDRDPLVPARAASINQPSTPQQAPPPHHDEAWIDPVTGETIEPIDSTQGLVMAGLILVIQLGIFGVSNSYATFGHQIRDALGASDADVSLPNAVMNGLAPVISIFAGALTDSIGPRPVLLGATVCMALGSLLGSLADSTVALVLLYGVPCGFGMASLSSPSAVALTSWLKHRLPLGVGIAYAGSGIGSSIVVAIAGVMAESSLGWRASFRLLSIFMGLGFVAALFIRPRKGHKHKPKLNVHGRGAEVLWFLKQLLTSKIFLLMFTAAAFFSFTMFSIFYVVVPYASKFGDITDFTPYVNYTPITVVSASTLFTFLGVARGITSVFGGALASRTDPTYVYALGAALCAAACAFWAVCTQYWHLAIICTFLGAAIALIFASFPAMAARSFAGRHCGLGVGLVMTGYSVGGFTGPPVVLSIVNGNGGNYTPAFILISWTSLIAGGIVLLLLRGEIRQQSFATDDALDALGVLPVTAHAEKSYGAAEDTAAAPEK